MKDMDGYFRKWREWRNTDLGSKSYTSIKGVENDEAEDIQSINQPIDKSINHSIDSMSIYFIKSYLFNKLLAISAISALYFLALAKFLANFR